VQSTAVDEYYVIVRLQRNYRRKHPQQQRSTGLGKDAPSAQVGSKKLASFRPPSG
jgi:hypothetical protein